MHICPNKSNEPWKCPDYAATIDLQQIVLYRGKYVKCLQV